MYWEDLTLKEKWDPPISQPLGLASEGGVKCIFDTGSNLDLRRSPHRRLHYLQQYTHYIIMAHPAHCLLMTAILETARCCSDHSTLSTRNYNFNEGYTTTRMFNFRSYDSSTEDYTSSEDFVPTSGGRNYTESQGINTLLSIWYYLVESTMVRK